MSDRAAKREAQQREWLRQKHTDLPSPYLVHREFGLLHLPRFLAKIRKHLAGELLPAYQRNFTKGFDRFLCLHLEIEPDDVIAAVREAIDEADLIARLREVLPEDCRTTVWNRQVVQIGLSEAGQEKLDELKGLMGIADRTDLKTFADLIDYDEGRLA